MKCTPGQLVRGLLLATNAGALLAMALITSLDVIGRYVANVPLPAAYEWVQLAMAVMVFAGLPIATAQREHVTVGLLEGALPPLAARLRRLLVDLLSAAFLAALGVYLALLAVRFARSAESLMLTGIPLAPLAWAMAVAAIGSAATVLWQLLRPGARQEQRHGEAT